MLISSGLNPSQYLSTLSSPQTGTKVPGSSSSSLQSISAASPSAGKNSASTNGAFSSSASTSNSSAGVPQSVLTAVENYVSPAEQAWNTLAQSLALGHVSSAQAALNDYTAALSAAKGPIAAPSNAFLSDLTALGNSLQAGDLSDATTAFAAAKYAAPSSASQDVFWSQSEASFDGWIAVYALEHGQSVNTGQLAGDIAGVDNSLREEGAYISDALVAQGYSQGAASNYAGEITGIASGTAQGDSAVDATRATQWIQALVEISQGGAPSPGYSNLQAPSSTAAAKSEVSDQLSSVLFSDAIESGKLLQTLIDYTLNVSSSASAAAASANGSGGNGGAGGNVNVYV